MGLSSLFGPSGGGGASGNPMDQMQAMYAQNMLGDLSSTLLQLGAPGLKDYGAIYRNAAENRQKNQSGLMQYRMMQNIMGGGQQSAGGQGGSPTAATPDGQPDSTPHQGFLNPSDFMNGPPSESGVLNRSDFTNSPPSSLLNANPDQGVFGGASDFMKNRPMTAQAAGPSAPAQGAPRAAGYTPQQIAAMAMLNPQLADILWKQYQFQHTAQTAAPNATVIDPNTGMPRYQIPSPGYRQNADGNYAYIPGGPDDPSVQRAQAAAKGWGEAGAKDWLAQRAPADLRPGGMRVGPNGVMAYNPEMVDSVNPNGSMSKTYMPPPFAIGRNATAGTQGAATGAPAAMISRQSPDKTAEQEAYGKDLGASWSTMADAASMAHRNNFVLDQMKRESQSWDMNRFADWKADGQAYLQAFAHTFKIDSESLDKPLADYTAFGKNSMELVRIATRETSSRAAVQEMLMIQKSLPSATMAGRGGFLQIADQMQSLNDFVQAKQQAAAQYRKQKGTLDGFSEQWNNDFSPTAFLFHRMDEKTLEQLRDNLVKTPEGRVAMARAKSQMEKAYELGLFQ